MTDYYAEQRRAWVHSLQDEEARAKAHIDRERAKAIEWLQDRWILIKGSPRPNWGVPGL